MSVKVRRIAIVGGIAVGKTTIGHILMDKLSNARFIEEDVGKNEFLEDFYADMKRWAFHSRISTLAMIASNYRLNGVAGTDNPEIILMDRCLDELITFAHLQYRNGNLSDKEFRVYRNLYENMVSFAPEMDGFIYCHCPSDISMDRIKKRNRTFEQGISLSYIERLDEEYESWISSLPPKKVLRVNTADPIDANLIEEFIMSL